MKIVEEYQLVKVEYLVDTKNKATALKTVKSMDGEIDFEEISKGGVFVKTQKYEVRDLTKKEKEEFNVVQAQQRWQDDKKDPQPPPPKKKRGRPKKKKAAVKKTATRKTNSKKVTRPTAMEQLVNIAKGKNVSK